MKISIQVIPDIEYTGKEWKATHHLLGLTTYATSFSEVKDRFVSMVIFLCDTLYEIGGKESLIARLVKGKVLYTVSENLELEVFLE